MDARDSFPSPTFCIGNIGIGPPRWRPGLAQAGHHERLGLSIYGPDCACNGVLTRGIVHKRRSGFEKAPADPVFGGKGATTLHALRAITAPSVPYWVWWRLATKNTDPSMLLCAAPGSSESSAGTLKSTQCTPAPTCSRRCLTLRSSFQRVALANCHISTPFVRPSSFARGRNSPIMAGAAGGPRASTGRNNACWGP